LQPFTIENAGRGTVIKRYNVNPGPALSDRVFDAVRLAGHPLQGTLAREVNQWVVVATRNANSPTATVGISGTSFNNRWTPRHPRSGAILSRNGFEVRIKQGFVVLASFNLGFTGNLNICRQGPDSVVFQPIQITSFQFDVMDNIEIWSRGELYYGCP
jgi:hypothetical protein